MTKSKSSKSVLVIPTGQGVKRRGGTPPKERQFGQPNGNPRNPGGWKKEDTARYKLERMLKMNMAQLLEIYNDDEASMFERRIARSILKENKWADTVSMINQVYGMPVQRVEQMNIELRPILPKPPKKERGQNGG